MRNEITVNSDSYTDQQIVSGAVYQVQSFDGDELQYDTLSAVVNAGAPVQPLLQTSDGADFLTADEEPVGVGPRIWVFVYDPNLYTYGAEVVYRHKGVLVGKYYMSKLTRVGKFQYKIECVSPVGMLANSQHYGGIYPNGIAFSELLTDIIGGIVPFTVATELENQLVYGWLPVATRRDNLHQALFAMGASAQKAEDGDLYFAPLSDETSTEIPDSRVFLNGSISYPDAVTKVSVSEHAYSVSDADETLSLFEGLVESVGITTPGGVSTQGSLVLFDEPMHDLAVENSEIIESGVNYAVLTPGSDVKLTGKKYTHTVRQVTRPESVEGAENNVTVTEATLVSVANSEAVADRLLSYYSSAKTISTDIVLEGEKAGSAVQITDPFGDSTNGIIKSLDINMSGTLKARAEIVADYSPGGAGNYYNNIEVITEDGEWTAPADGRVRIVLISGGQGGASGGYGADGEDGSGTFFSGSAPNGASGAGGVAGPGGAGGRVCVVSFDVTAGDVFSITIGQGGAGGISEGLECIPGSDGTDTTFGDYTSADGSVSASGYYDLFEAITYALPGDVGIAGAAGAEYGVKSDTVTINGVTYTCGANGKASSNAYWNANYYVRGYGSYGGGAAAGANGGDGNDGTTKTSSYGFVNAYGGDGGAGGSATISGANGVQYGSGGSGGHGGGGGGGGGGGYCYGGYDSDGNLAQMAVNGGSGGSGGAGSTGGQGAQGCVLVYY